MTRLIAAASSVVLSQYLLLMTTTLFYPSDAGDNTLTTNQTIADDGGTLISSSGRFALGFFSPVASTKRYIGMWYNNIPFSPVVWVANRQHPLLERRGILSLLPNGTLVIVDENRTAVWSSSSSSVVRNPVAQLLDDGNFVVGEADIDTYAANSFAWQSFDFPSDTLLPGMKLGWNLTTRFDRQLSSWKSAADPAPGEFTSGIDLRGDPQIFEWSGGRPVWRGGPWNGLRFTGVPQMQLLSKFSLQFSASEQEAVYTFDVLDPSVISRLVVNSSGVVQWMVWVEQTEYWNIFWIAPMLDRCDGLSPCGPNSVCSTDGSSMHCSCLQGFRPTNPGNWADGCARKTSLDCRDGADGFSLVRGLKLPDTSSSVVNWSMSMEECRALCSKDCSCTAYAQANISGGGSGCIRWSSDLTDLRMYANEGQDLYTKLAAADLGIQSRSNDPRRRRHVAVIIVVATATPAAAAFIFLALVAYSARRNKKIKFQRYLDEGTKDSDLPLFDLKTIKNATNNFSVENKLGQGGFGPVYKGMLVDKQEIAVKLLSQTSKQGLDEFKNEILLIAKLQHRNLIRLLGYCIEGQEKMLIYEYLPNNSLDSFLFDKAKGVLLNWPTRYKIIIGIARGLLYLHQDSRFRIIHRDLKASNILLDLDMNPKISDFGMARIFGSDESEVNTNRVVGTYGYMSPEYVMDGIFSIKSDVFSFGVLILEIISGKRNRGIYPSMNNMNLLGYAWSLWKEGKNLELVDESIGYSFTAAEASRCIKIGLLCIQERPQDRPTMHEVLLMLAGENDVSSYPNQPGFFNIITPHGIDSPVSNQKFTINEVTLTLFEGR